MGSPSIPSSIIRFGVYELDVRKNELRKHGSRIRLQEQPLQVLAVLLQCPGELVSREDLRNRVWPRDTFVSFDHALNTAVKKVRAALNDDADAPRYVETVPRRGYRFIAPVASATSEALAAEVASAAESRRRNLRLGGFSIRILSITAGVLAVFVALFGYLNMHRMMAGAGVRSRRAMVAVLPFQNLSGDPSQDYFSDGLTEEAIAQVARISPEQFSVIARTSAMKYKHTMKSISEIARELHADYLVEGSVRRDGNQIRIVAQLVRASDQTPHWTKDFNSEIGETLSIESKVGAEIASEVNAAIGNPASPRHVMEDDKYDAHLRSLAGSNIHTEEGLTQIIAAFQQATKDDPKCAVPYSGLAYTYERGANLGFLRPRDAYPKAREAALRAIAIYPGIPEAHAYLADAELTINHNWQGAQQEIEKALELNANDPLAHQWHGVLLSAQGNLDLALAESRRAVELDPLVPGYLDQYGVILMRAGRLEEAEKQFKAALQLDPALAETHQQLVDLYHSEKKYDESIGEWGTVLWLLGQRDAAVKIKNTYARSGYEAARRQALTLHLGYLNEMSKQRYISPYSFASVNAKLGNKEQTLAWLEKAYDERDVCIFGLRWQKDGSFAFVRNEPRYLAVVEKIHFPE
jgi:TolB-like protein/DNA-binding winged helix-turn-helix (wHTH) protein/tetratricopeptide (TPR) repeat protein